MRNATIRIVLILALISAIGIISTQVFWVKRAYNLEEKEATHKITNALRNVSLQIGQIQNATLPPYNLVDMVNDDYFIVRMSGNLPADTLSNLLQAALEHSDLITDFQYGIYAAGADTFQEIHYIHMTGNNEDFKPTASFPFLKSDHYYFGIYFPHRNQFLSSRLSFWIYSSVLLLFVLFFLGYFVFIILKQKRLSEIQKDFINNMTHEFKTPLTSIGLAANALTHPNIIQRPDRLLNYTAIIKEEADHLTSQVERVLQMAHAEKGMLPLKQDKICFNSLLNEVSKRFQEQIQQKDGQLIVKLPEKSIFFKGDELHLTNVVSNLIDNALKYSEEKPLIQLELKENKKEIVISVKDNGIGISKEAQKMLFKRFYRVPTGNVHNVKGFGIGLNYVQSIMKSYNGTVTCESQPGKGSTFNLIFKK